MYKSKTGRPKPFTDRCPSAGRGLVPTFYIVLEGTLADEVIPTALEQEGPLRSSRAEICFGLHTVSVQLLAATEVPRGVLRGL